MLERLKEWWRRPPVRDRILAALSPTEWRRGLAVSTEAKTWSYGGFYVAVEALEREGLVESKWEECPPAPVRGGYRRRIYRLTGPRDQ